MTISMPIKQEYKQTTLRVTLAILYSNTIYLNMSHELDFTSLVNEEKVYECT